MIREDLVAERIAIESYSRSSAILNNDPTSRRLMEEILQRGRTRGGYEDFARTVEQEQRQPDK
jgi:bacterioferritin (cytochrome b1)